MNFLTGDQATMTSACQHYGDGLHDFDHPVAIRARQAVLQDQHTMHIAVILHHWHACQCANCLLPVSGALVEQSVRRAGRLHQRQGGGGDIALPPRPHECGPDAAVQRQAARGDCRFQYFSGAV